MVDLGISSILNGSFPESAASIAEKLDSVGFVCLESVISGKWLERARAAVEAYEKTHGQKFFSIINPEGRNGAPFHDIAHCPKLRQLLHELSRAACPETDKGLDECYSTLRVNAGSRGGDGALNFHYDASTVTAVIPIFIPNGELGKCGELVTIENTRPFRRFVAHNIIEKAALQNPALRQLAMSRLMAGHNPNVRSLIPGNLYLFWGYRTFHGTLACDPPGLRATFIVHYGNPHGKSLILRMIRRGRRIVESLRLKYA